MSDSLALKIDTVSKRFGGVTALADVSLQVREKTCFGLLGPNGAGKTTLIRSIIGRVRPDAGAVAIFGAAARSSTAKASIGWVPQDLALYPRLSCRENLEAFGRYQGLKGKPLHEAIAWSLEWAGLTERAGSVVQTLSGGMKRRLNLAAGIIHRPRLVLLDEPTVGVDPQSRNRLFEMVGDLRSQGATVIYTTHYMEEAERLCDRIAILDHAHIIAEGTKEELITQCFGSRYDVQVHLASEGPAGEAWARGQGGTVKSGVAQFSIARPVEIAGLLQSAEAAGLEIADVVLRRPNLESVFLHLTGRELRS